MNALVNDVGNVLLMMPSHALFRLRPRAQFVIPSAAVHFLLGHAEQLEHIELYCCDEFSDADVKTLFLSSKDLNLNTLHNINIRGQRVDPAVQIITNPNTTRSPSQLDNRVRPTLTNHSWTQSHALMNGKLSHLKCFIMRHGHAVTKEGIGGIISQAPRLQYIDCGRPPLKKGQNLDED